MNKKYINLIISTTILLFLIEIFDHSNIIINTILESSFIWFKNIVPTLFPIYLITDLLLNYHFLDYLSKIFGNFMEKVFKMKKQASFVFFMSIISGFPSNSKYIKNLLDDKLINKKEANKLLMFTHFSNPLFIISSLGEEFLQNKQIGILILIIHYLTNFIIGFMLRNSYINLEDKKTKEENKKTSFVTCLTNSIYNTIKILFLLYGIITFFMIITSVIKVNIKLPSILNTLLCGLLEMTQGCFYTSKLNIPIDVKATLMTFFISFGGFSIHMQVFSILNEYQLKYKNYLFSRIIHALIASSLVYLILNFN